MNIHKLKIYDDLILDRQIDEIARMSKPLYAAGIPSSVTPRYLGDEYLNITTGDWYKASGVTSADWKKIT